GREMARVMSYVMIVFMIVPIVAPSFGQLIILYANWHWIFILLGIIATIHDRADRQRQPFFRRQRFLKPEESPDEQDG
ncbi:hypothetical protein ACC687_42475, partial [Rhizobium ruizarguesonis]